MQQSDESAAIRGPHVRPWYATDNRLLSILCHPIGVLLFWCALSYCRNLGPKKNRGPRFFLFWSPSVGGLFHFKASVRCRLLAHRVISLRRQIRWLFQAHRSFE